VLARVEKYSRSQLIEFLKDAGLLHILVLLLVALLTASAFAGEREQGTMRQLLSLGIRPLAAARPHVCCGQRIVHQRWSRDPQMDRSPAAGARYTKSFSRLMLQSPLTAMLLDSGRQDRFAALHGLSGME
jgi:hypothetical protein